MNLYFYAGVSLTSRCGHCEMPLVAFVEGPTVEPVMPSRLYRIAGSARSQGRR